MKITTDNQVFLTQWEPSGWRCYMYGNRPGGVGMVYRPAKGCVPNWIARLMMRVLLDCLWVKDKEANR